MKSSLKTLAIVLTVLATTAHAEQGESNLEAIGNKLRTLYPATQFNEIRPSQFEGMYEVVMGKNVGYTDGAGAFFSLATYSTCRRNKT